MNYLQIASDGLYNLNENRPFLTTVWRWISVRCGLHRAKIANGTASIRTATTASSWRDWRRQTTRGPAGSSFSTWASRVGVVQSWTASVTWSAAVNSSNRLPGSRRAEPFSSIGNILNHLNNLPINELHFIHCYTNLIWRLTNVQRTCQTKCCGCDKAAIRVPTLVIVAMATSLVWGKFSFDSPVF